MQIPMAWKTSTLGKYPREYVGRMTKDSKVRQPLNRRSTRKCQELDETSAFKMAGARLASRLLSPTSFLLTGSLPHTLHCLKI